MKNKLLFSFITLIATIFSCKKEKSENINNIFYENIYTSISNNFKEKETKVIDPTTEVSTIINNSDTLTYCRSIDKSQYYIVHKKDIFLIEPINDSYVFLYTSLNNNVYVFDLSKSSKNNTPYMILNFEELKKRGWHFSGDFNNTLSCALEAFMYSLSDGPLFIADALSFIGFMVCAFDYDNNS